LVFIVQGYQEKGQLPPFQGYSHFSTRVYFFGFFNILFFCLFLLYVWNISTVFTVDIYIVYLQFLYGWVENGS